MSSLGLWRAIAYEHACIDSEHVDTISYCTDGPSFSSHQVVPSHGYVQLGDSLSLICGTGLDSNPQATITWTSPDGSTIMNSSRYHLENGPDVVRLNLTQTVLNDAGVWHCNVSVFSEQHIIVNGEIASIDPTIIGAPIENTIHLTVIRKSL